MILLQRNEKKHEGAKGAKNFSPLTEKHKAMCGKKTP
jgi:hypothetical protein